MKTKKYALIVLSFLLILLVFASAAGAADANATDVLSVDESTSNVNEKLALDYSLDNAVANDTNAVENDENILAMANNDVSNGTLTETEGHVGLTSEFSATSNGIYYVNATVDNEILGVNMKVGDSEPIPTNITVDHTSLDLTIDETGTINATLNPPEAGGLEVDYNETIIKVEQDERTREWIVTALAEGNTNITFSFTGRGQYAAAENKTVKVTVNAKPIPTNITVNTTSLDLTVGESGYISAKLNPPEAGNLEFDYDETIIGVEQEELTEKWIVKGVAEGKTNITFSFPGSEGYAAAENKTVTVTVNAKPAPSINVVAENLTKYYGGSEQFSVNVTDEEGKGVSNKTVSITINGVNYDRTTDENGTARLNINLPSGDYAANVTVDNITVNATVTVLPTVSGSDVRKAYGQSASYNATFLDSTGKYLSKDTIVSFNINGEIQNANISDDNGLASLNINLPVGEYIVTATNPVTGENASNNITVTRADLNIEANAEPITVGDNATVIVSGFLSEQGSHATGNVTVTAEGKTYNGTIVPHLIGGAIAEIIVPGLNETTIAEVNYLGDDNYNPANTTVEIIVNTPSKKNLTISASAEPITIGNNATVVVTGFVNNGFASGTVTVTAAGKTYNGTIVPHLIGGAIAEIIVPGLNETTIAEVNYLGDEYYNPANTTVNITVNPKEKENATISIDAPSESPEGDNVTVTVTLPEDATGNITIGNETIPLVNGTASAVLTNLPVGNTTVPITYSGDEKYNPIETEINITVIEDKSINVKAPDVTKYYHGPERFVVNVTNSKGKALANKSVTITINGVTYNRTTNANGTCSLALNLDANVYNVTTTVENTTVNSVVTIFTTVNGTDVVKIFKNDTQYYATFLDANGKYLAEGSAVRFNINGVMYDRKVTGDKGLAKLNINLQHGKYVITATNLNTTEMSSNNITVLSTVNGTDVVKMYRNGTQYYATFIDTDGKFLADGTVVKFNINGVVYDRKVSGDKGQAKLNINLPAGEYVITAINTVTGENAANNITVLSTVIENRDIIKYYRNATQYSVKVLGADGNPIGEGKLVSFNINGVVYQRQTNASSIAQLNINLPPGNYVITASYDGCSVSNDITVLPVLSASDLKMKYMDGSKFKATLLDGQGKPYAGQKIQFNVNGVLYSRTTDSNGQAELNIRLPSGEYIITSSYNGCNIANKITIRS